MGSGQGSREPKEEGAPSSASCSSNEPKSEQLENTLGFYLSQQFHASVQITNSRIPSTQTSASSTSLSLTLASETTTSSTSTFLNHKKLLG